LLDKATVNFMKLLDGPYHVIVMASGSCYLSASRQ
jgi:hypothetical protein